MTKECEDNCGSDMWQKKKNHLFIFLLLFFSSPLFLSFSLSFVLKGNIFLQILYFIFFNINSEIQLVSFSFFHFINYNLEHKIDEKLELS
ncbi:hypothetical protein QVD17_38315 [Tagetes erecta]|uniref:Uncharacterized protein n=1 Tax=Tagetes erecta TaxID=13708 RepID=A0AAD8JQB8_TARER|nr:hypothetical protein QVD17_38315 [Tagetes erecta]